MNEIKNLLVTLSVIPLMCSCSIIQKTSKQEVSSGFYQMKTKIGKQKVYVNENGDDIEIYPTISFNEIIEVDTLNLIGVYKAKNNSIENSAFKLTKSSLDLDLLTIPAKLRFATKQVPIQLNTEFNGSGFLGYRKDIYNVEYEPNPLNISERNTLHFAYSIGVFSGFGNTFISPTTTDNNLEQEYDGVVWSKGIAGIVDVNNLSIGLTLGFDNLLDTNNDIWIYENKPWLGFALGLNLN